MSALWQTYNSEESWLPFFAPLVFWIGTVVYCWIPASSASTPRPVWHKWQSVHDLHNYGIIVMGWKSLYFNDDSVFNDRVGILWSISYFAVELLDCIYRRDAAYTFHALLCVVLGIGNYVTPLNRQLRMNSRAAQCELSTYFMKLSKRTRKPLDFVLFALVFTLCRVVHIPMFLLLPCYRNGMEWTHWIMISLTAFYGLNLFWYVKILQILLNGLLGKTDEANKKADKEE